MFGIVEQLLNLGNAGALANVAAALEARRAEDEVVGALVARIAGDQLRQPAA